MATKSTPTQTFHVPGLTAEESTSVVSALQDRLNAFNDLHLMLKHVHWNVVGPNFIGVHEMLDPQVELVRGYRRRDRRAHRHHGRSPDRHARRAGRRPLVGRLRHRQGHRARPTSARSTSSTPASSRTTATRSTSSARSTR